MSIGVLQQKIATHFDRRGMDWVRIQHLVQETFSGKVLVLPDSGREVVVQNCWFDMTGHLTLRVDGKNVDCGGVM